MAGSRALDRQRTAPGEPFPHSLRRAAARINHVPYWPVLALTLGAVCVDSWLVAELNTIAPIFSCGLLLVLALRGSFRGSLSSPRTTPVAWWRLYGFLGFHLMLIAAASSSGGLWNGTHSTSVALALAASKYLILLPSAILLSSADWRQFARLYRNEGIAAAVALISFFPLRIFTMAWPWYGQVLGRSVYSLARLFVPGTQYVAALTPTLIGKNLEVTIVFGCSGLQGIKLFQILFALMLVLDWNDLNRARAAAAYFGGLATMLIANVLRITLLFVLGNTSLQNRVLQYHLTGGWILFTLAFVAYLLIAYRWMLKRPPSV